jgi:hypothetical protein
MQRKGRNRDMARGAGKNKDTRTPAAASKAKDAPSAPAASKARGASRSKTPATAQGASKTSPAPRKAAQVAKELTPAPRKATPVAREATPVAKKVAPVAKEVTPAPRKAARAKAQVVKPAKDAKGTPGDGLTAAPKPAPGRNSTTESGTPAEQISVRGVVAPSEWDMRDEVTAVTIYAQDESEFVVNARAMVKRLVKFMDEEIEAHGMLGVDEYGNEVFMVADFAPVDVEADEDGEVEWDEEEDSLLDDDAEGEEGGTGDETDGWGDDSVRRRRGPGGWKRRPRI